MTGEKLRVIVDRGSFAVFVVALAGFVVSVIWGDWTAAKFCASAGIVCLGVGILTRKPSKKTNT